MRRVIYAAVACALAGGFGLAGGGIAAAGETGVIYGRKACEDLARQYRDMGYTARCNHIHGERFYVYFDKPRGGRPSTGSAGSS